ncbi:MAG: FG-GAP-like repeat-containing protein [Rhodothermales bacterium]
MSLILLGVVFWGIGGTQQAVGQLAFTEVGVAAGVGNDLYDTGHAHGLGVNWIDYDMDGFPDLFMTNGEDLDAHLYRNNNGDGTFTNMDALLPALPNVELTSTAFADYDNDGDMDIYITANNNLTSLDGPVNVLLKNLWVENGNQASTPLFTDVAAAAGVENRATPALGNLPGYNSLTTGWVDYNRDSCIDLFVGNMVFSQGGQPANLNALYMNNCDGTFTNVTASSGVNPTGQSLWYRPTLAFFGGIMDPNDLWPDLYVVNVQEFSPYHHDLQYRNNGDGTFTEWTSQMPGIGDDSGAGMGIDVADIDHDGDWDIYMSDLLDPGNEPVAEGNVLYLGNPDGTWNDNSAIPAGVKAGGSWGINFADFDNDTFEDMMVAAGDPLLFKNDTDGTFTDVSASSGMLNLGGSGRGSAVADFDRDGDLDFVVIYDGGTVGEPNIQLYKNVSAGLGNWLQVDLNATVSNRAAIGALVEATVNGVKLMRQVKGGSSAHSQDDLLVHFGLGSATTVSEVKISWPSGIVQTLTNVPANQMLSITEEATPPSGDLFTDVTAPMGVDVTHDGWDVGGMGIGTGAAWFDYDNDGDLDLYMTMRAGANKLFKNNGGSFTDVAASAGVTDASHDGSGVAVADYNNDGCKDLYLANNDEDVLYRNNCDGTFTDVTNTPGSDLSDMMQARGTSASWGDYDNDGLVDLYVANHAVLDGNVAPGGTARQQAQDYLFHNNGDDTFTDVSSMLLGVDREGMSFIGSWTDYDRDGDLDIFLISDCPFSSTAPQRLWRNDGGTNGLSDWTFTETSAAANANWCQNGMGIAVGDYDRDGDQDFFYTDDGNNGDSSPTRAGTLLLKNDGDGTFSDGTAAAGVSSTSFSWGAGFFDYDLDGWQDLYMAAGRVFIEQTPDANVLWHNNGGTFSNVSAGSGVNDANHGRTPIYGDYDGDGDPDLFLVNHGGPTKLFRNDNANGNRWLIVDLVGTTSNRDGIGARIAVSTPDGATQTVETRSGSSLSGGDDIGAYFGLGSNLSISSIQITWPSGVVQTLTGIAVNQRLTITEEGGVGNQPPVASFTATTNGLAVDVDASASTDDSAIVSYAWTFGDGATGTGVTASHTYAAAGTYTVALTVTDDEGATGSTSKSVTVSDGTGTGAFLESGGLVSMEAENFHSQVDRDGHTWTSTTASAGFSGAAAMQATPDDGTRVRTGPEAVSPELVFEVNFATTGTYYVWQRIWGVDSRGNKAFAGLDGTAESSPLKVNTFGSWLWANSKQDGGISTIEVTSAGVHTVHVWMGDDGVFVDKVVLSTDAGFVPTGTGPAESPKDGGDPVNPAPVASFTVTQGAGEFDFDVDGSASTDDGAIVSYDWTFGDGATATGATASHTYGAYGTYTVTLTVTDDLGATGSTSQTVTIVDPNGSGAFLEAGGMVVMEAEHFHDNIARGADSWAAASANAGASGASYMVSTPDDGTQIDSGVETSSPEFSFDVEFTTTGDYYIWARVWADNNRANSGYAGVDGAVVPNANGLTVATFSAWTWVTVQKGSTPVSVNIGSAGAHTVHVWMREDGLAVDKVLLTTDAGFTPTGEGPAESPQGSAAPVAGALRGVAAEGLMLQAEALPTEFALEGNYPNPFNPTTTIRFALPEAAQVRLTVYDMLGREVARVFDGELPAGRHEASWNGRTDAGATVSSGAYLLRMSAGSFSAVKRMVVVK